MKNILCEDIILFYWELTYCEMPKIINETIKCLHNFFHNKDI
jgi:hypothetical protein